MVIRRECIFLTTGAVYLGWLSLIGEVRKSLYEQ